MGLDKILMLILKGFLWSVGIALAIVGLTAMQLAITVVLGLFIPHAIASVVSFIIFIMLVITVAYVLINIDMEKRK